MSVLSDLRTELDALSATDVQRRALEANPARAKAALDEARKRGAQSPIAYALSMFNSPEFSPRNVEQKAGTNRHATVNCRTCDGDRMVVYSMRTDTYNGRSAEVEEYAPCADCNPSCNTSRPDFRSPDPAKVRERIAHAL